MSDSATKLESFSPNLPQVIKESPSISSSLGKPEVMTPSTTHDNSITSDPSEATNTISDDTTVIKTPNVNIPNATSSSPLNDDNKSQEIINKSEKCAKEKQTQHSEVSEIEVYQILGMKFKMLW